MQIQLGNQTMEAGRVFCIGRNYAEHIAELGNERPESPVIFTKPATSLVSAAQRDIPFPRSGECPHYETEIVVLIGREGYPADAQDAVNWISGIGAGLDLTLRETQNVLLPKGLPWDICKGFDHSAPVGTFSPFSGTAEDLRRLRFTGAVNGRICQRGDSSLMIFPIPELIMSIARYWRLLPGDLIFTGTPPGVGRLNPGDVVGITDPSGAYFEWRLASPES